MLRWLLILLISPLYLLHDKTPYKCIYGVPPSYDSICVLGCLCYAAHRPRVNDKFDCKSR